MLWILPVALGFRRGALPFSVFQGFSSHSLLLVPLPSQGQLGDALDHSGVGGFLFCYARGRSIGGLWPLRCAVALPWGGGLLVIVALGSGHGLC